MKINAMIEVEIFDDQAEEIFVQFLKKEYVEHVRNPFVIVTEEIVDNNRVTAAMAQLIKYYSTKDEYLEFMEETHGE
jgi:hypothetical protein